MSRSQRDRCEERFHAHHSGTYSASAETLGPDELLALAPNEFVRDETFLQALYVLPEVSTQSRRGSALSLPEQNRKLFCSTTPIFTPLTPVVTPALSRRRLPHNDLAESLRSIPA